MARAEIINYVYRNLKEDEIDCDPIGFSARHTIQRRIKKGNLKNPFYSTENLLSKRIKQLEKLSIQEKSSNTIARIPTINDYHKIDNEKNGLQFIIKDNKKTIKYLLDINISVPLPYKIALVLGVIYLFLTIKEYYPNYLSTLFLSQILLPIGIILMSSVAIHEVKTRKSESEEFKIKDMY